MLVQQGSSRLYSEWGIRKQLLDDLYVRFLRLAEERIGIRAEYGVVSFISNYSFLTGRSHPIMRESLASNFHEIWIDNLNGDKYKTGKVIPDGLPGAGSSDQSVFTTDHDPRGIQPGTCISTYVKKKEGVSDPAQTPIQYREFWGKANDKRRALFDSLQMDSWTQKKKDAVSGTSAGPRDFETFFPTPANRWRFAPRDISAGYEAWPSLDELFPSSYQGVNPNRGIDESVIDFDAGKLRDRMRYYFESDFFAAVRDRYPVLTEPRARYDPEKTWSHLREHTSFDPARVVKYLLFPLDRRWIYYESEAKLLNEKRLEYWENLEGNEFLVAVPEPRQASEVFPLLSTILVDLHVHDRGSVCFPRETRPGTLIAQSVANIAEPAWNALKTKWNLAGDRTGDDAKALVGELFRLVMAFLYSPGFQEEHQGALAEGWASIPIPKSRKLHSRTARLGSDLVTLLDPESEPDSVLTRLLGKQRLKTLGVLRKGDGTAIQDSDLVVQISYFGGGRGRWIARDFRPDEHPHETWGAQTGDLFIQEGVCFDNVPERVWSFEIGGYPVLKKWLGYRQASRRNGAPLSIEERRHFRSMIQRIAAVLSSGGTADNLYDECAADSFTAEDLGLS